jgi:serine protease SohB
MEFFLDYAAFAAKVTTVILLVVGAILLVVVVSARTRQTAGEALTIKRINDRIESLADTVRAASMPEKALKKYRKARKKAAKAATDDKERPRLFLLRFDGDIRASQVSQLREEISAVISAAEPTDEVVLCLESGGGMVHGYGLAASQLARLRDANLKLTVCIDKVAASGGYMMACVADRVRAAPFAIIGSIGVVMQLPNFNRLLKENHIDFEMVTAGKYKRTLTMFGENSPEGREKVQAELEQTHVLFKDFIQTFRPGIALEQVATGEHWFGSKALELGLVDELGTSDDFLLDAAADRDIFEISFKTKKPITERLLERGTDSLLRLFA